MSILLGQSWIDYQIQRTTLLLVSDVFYNDGLSLDVFSLNAKRRDGKVKGQRSKLEKLHSVRWATSVLAIGILKARGQGLGEGWNRRILL